MENKFLSFVAFNSAEVRSNANFLMDRYLNHSMPLKGTKTFHHIEIVNKIHGYFDLAVLVVLPLQLKMKINRNSLSISFIE